MSTSAGSVALSNQLPGPRVKWHSKNINSHSSKANLSEIQLIREPLAIRRVKTAIQLRFQLSLGRAFDREVSLPVHSTLIKKKNMKEISQCFLFALIAGERETILSAGYLSI